MIRPRRHIPSSRPDKTGPASPTPRGSGAVRSRRRRRERSTFSGPDLRSSPRNPMAVLESRDSGKTFHIVTLSPEAESLDPPVQSGSECNDAADHLPILQDIDVCRAMTRAWRTGTPSLLSDIYFNTGTRSGWRNAFVFRLGSNRVGIIYDDITPHKEAQRHQLQARKLEALGTLARGVSHELNNILMAITGFTGLALSRSEDDKIRTYLKHIQAAHTRAESLVRQLHFFSRTEQTSMESLDIGIMARECLQSLKATLPDTLTTSFYAASDLYRIKGDPSLIHQLLDQLMHNAAQALPQEGGQLFVHIENVPPGPLDEPGLFSVAETEQGWVRIEIRDTGPGMAPNVQDRIFDPFFTTRPMPGRLGLGLSVVHGIVQAHNGYLSVHAPRGQGSSFTILLPGIVPEPGKNAPFPATALLRDATLRPKHVLIIDDQPELLLMQQEGLEGMGYKTTCCLTGEDGLRTYLEYRDAIDIVLVDYAMPDMNGLEVAERIHAHSSTPPPILLYTGFLPIDIRDSLDLPFITEILYKPISIKELASRLRQTLDTPTKDER